MFKIDELKYIQFSRKSFVLLILVLIAINTTAQTFSVREDFPNPSSGNSAYAIEYFSDQIVTFHAGLTDDGQHVGLLCHDLAGELVQTIDLFSPELVQIPGGPNCTTLNEDGTELVVIYNEDSIGDGITHYRSKVLVYNENFDVIKTWVYEPDSVLTFFTEIISLSNGGYQIIGWTEETGNDTRGVRVVNLDIDLQEQWQLTLPGDYDPWGFGRGLQGYHMIQLENGNSLLSCLKTYLDSFDECSDGWYKTNPLFILIDDQGEEIWRDEWDDCYTNPAASLMQHSNGDVYIAHTRQDPEISTHDVNWLDLYLTRYTPEGDIVWEKSYGVPAINKWAHKIIEIEDEEVLIAGFSWGPTPGQDTGYLLNTNEEGDSLWMRYHRYAPEIRSRLRDVVKINENCIISCGSCYPTEEYPSYDSWIVKFDGLGCLEEGCDVSIAESEALGLDLYPNPAVNTVHIQGLPFANKNIKLSLVSASGAVQDIDFTVVGQQYISVDVSSVSSGIYRLLLYFEHEVYSEKVVVIRQ